MKKVFYRYSSNIKGLPKGFIFMIVLFLLILIPIIISFVLIGGALTILSSAISRVLPFRKKKIQAIETEEGTIIDITPRKGLLK